MRAAITTILVVILAACGAMGASTANKQIPLKVHDKLVLATAVLSDVTVGQGYSDQLTATGGIAPYVFTVDPASPNQLPAGLTLSPDGMISGTVTALPSGPNVTCTSTGCSVPITFVVTDSGK